MPRFSKAPVTCLDAVSATGVGTTIDVADYRHIVVQISAALNSTLTIKFQGSVSVNKPTFSNAQSSTNHWDYVESYDLQDSTTAIAGDTGVALNDASVAANTRQYIINTDFYRHFNIEVTAFTDGDVTAFVTGVNDTSV